jgi:hypothetical protein
MHTRLFIVKQMAKCSLAAPSRSCWDDVIWHGRNGRWCGDEDEMAVGAEIRECAVGRSGDGDGYGWVVNDAVKMKMKVKMGEMR